MVVDISSKLNDTAHMSFSLQSVSCGVVTSVFIAVLALGLALEPLG